MKITNTYVFFWSGIYSNWTHAPFTLYCHPFDNTEQAFMWLKAVFFNDEVTASKILKTFDPKEAKNLGREVKGYDDVEWTKVRYEFMYRVCLAKFKQNPHLCRQLLDTGDRVFVEASPVDKLWGIGMRETDDGVQKSALII